MFANEVAIQKIIDVMMPVKPPEMSVEDFRRAQRGVATKYVQTVTDVLRAEVVKNKIIAFDRDVFDAFMIDIAHMNLLTPRVGGLLNRLMESQVILEPVAWTKDGDFGLGKAESTETSLFRATWLTEQN